jgi:hypothetical protein
MPSADPMERMIEDALIAAGIRYQSDFGEGTSHHLDFHLPDYDVAIEVKQMHSPRISDQMARAPNVIVAQGRGAVALLAEALRGMGRAGDNLTAPGSPPAPQP